MSCFCACIHNSNVPTNSSALLIWLILILIKTLVISTAVTFAFLLSFREDCLMWQMHIFGEYCWKSGSEKCYVNNCVSVLSDIAAQNSMESWFNQHHKAQLGCGVVFKVVCVWFYQRILDGAWEVHMVLINFFHNLLTIMNIQFIHSVDTYVSECIKL